MKNRTDLILGEAFCIFIFFYFLDSGLSVLNGLQFYFRLRDSENREYTFQPLIGFCIYTRSDLNKIREETIKNYDLIDRSGQLDTRQFKNRSL